MYSELITQKELGISQNARFQQETRSNATRSNVSLFPESFERMVSAHKKEIVRDLAVELSLQQATSFDKGFTSLLAVDQAILNIRKASQLSTVKVT